MYALVSVPVILFLLDIWPIQPSGGEQQLLSVRTDTRSELDP